MKYIFILSPFPSTQQENENSATENVHFDRIGVESKKKSETEALRCAEIRLENLRGKIERENRLNFIQDDIDDCERRCDSLRATVKLLGLQLEELRKRESMLR